MTDFSPVQNALAFSEEHLSKYTGCIHYKSQREMTRDVIPMVENILYGAALVTTFSKEKAEKGLAFLERIFHFCTNEGFGSYLHDFPNVYNHHANVNICLALAFFLRNYGRFIPASSKSKIEKVLDQLKTVLESSSLNEIDTFIFESACFKTPLRCIEAKTQPEYEKLILCKLFLGQEVCLNWHRGLNVYTGPLAETYYIGHDPTESLISLLATGKGAAESSLFAALLPKTGISELITFKTFDREDLVVNHRDNLLSIHFGQHSFIAKGEIDVKVTNDHIDIMVDEFEEMEFFFTDTKGSKILVDGEKATAFYPEDIITLITPDKQITVKFISNKIRFIGHIMKGNRHNQILDCEKNFALFDHMILLSQVV